MSKRIHPMIQIVLLFAAIGFLLQLISDPLETLLILGLTALLLYFLNRYMKTGRFLRRRSSPAAKRPYRSSAAVSKRTEQPRKRHPFYVIEGSKGKSSNSKEQQSKTYH
ncbi:hypothetical protein [Brevibacillus marinus]|uniref:hypothetical protein n=1 Tax=Brevibacillus marinus TaxID=2496837 RepID=UPI000F84DB99|nr:hypothetical protein [Brevibacillus marinus]